MTAAAERDVSPDRWDREVDLLVAGAGPAGMAAALVGAIEGLSVVVCEKAAQVGGTGATSAGTLWIPGNRPGRDAGHSDSPGDGARYLDAVAARPDDDVAALRAAYFRDGPEVVDYLEARSELRFVSCGVHPDYRSNQPGAAVAGRAIVPELFDGRLLGADFGRVRPPIEEFMLFGGMMVSKEDIGILTGRSPRKLLHAAGLVSRYLLDRLRHRRGTRLTMGNALVGRLYHSLRARGVPVLFEAPAVGLVGGNGGVRGAVIEENGRRRRIRARRGVVLATGGLARNARLRERFLPETSRRRSMAAAECTGDGIDMAVAAGGSLRAEGHRSGGFWSPVSVTKGRGPGGGLFPHLSLDRAKPGLIAVNAAGRRFVNEASSYHDFVEGMHRSHETVPSIPAWLVCDAAFVRRYGLGAIRPGTRNLRPFAASGYVALADTLEGLAVGTGIDASGLADTVARHNGFAAAGSDPDFGKGDSEFDRFNGDAGRGPNPCLAPVETPPFAAVAVWPAEIGCSVGLATTDNGEVLDADGRAIPGLYACGNDMSSMMSGTYPGPGITLGPAFVFGYRAARHAAARATA